MDVLAAYQAHAGRVVSAIRGFVAIARAWERRDGLYAKEAMNLRAEAARRMARLRKRRAVSLRLAGMQRAALARVQGGAA